LRVALVGAGLMAAMPAFALDGSKTDGSIGPPPMTPVEAFRLARIGSRRGMRRKLSPASNTPPRKVTRYAVGRPDVCEGAKMRRTIQGL
jgi:hypothetical protein